MRNRAVLVLGLFAQSCLASENLALPNPPDGPFQTVLLAVRLHEQPSLFRLSEDIVLPLSTLEPAEAFTVFYREDLGLPPGPVTLLDPPKVGTLLPAPHAIYVSELAAERTTDWRTVESMPDWIAALRVDLGLEEECPDLLGAEFSDTSSVGVADRLSRNELLVVFANGSVKRVSRFLEEELMPRASVLGIRSIFAPQGGHEAWLGGEEGELFHLDLEAGVIRQRWDDLFGSAGPVSAIAGAPDGSEIFAVAREGTLARHTPDRGWEVFPGWREAKGQDRRDLMWVEPGHVVEARERDTVRRFVQGELRNEPAEDAGLPQGLSLTAVGTFQGQVVVAGHVRQTANTHALYTFDEHERRWLPTWPLPLLSQGINRLAETPFGLVFGATSGWAGFVMPDGRPCEAVRLPGADHSLDFLVRMDGPSVALTGAHLTRIFWAELD